MVSLCFVAVCCRYAVRIWRKAWSFWLSDLFLLVAVISFTILAIGDIVVITNLDPYLPSLEAAGFTKVRFLPRTCERVC